MSDYLKRIAFIVTDIFGFLFRIIPFSVRKFLIKSLIFVESRINSGTADSLVRLFKVYDDLDLIINKSVMFYGKGMHPKHKLISYHDFFINNIKPGESVLDIGCGSGYVAKSIADAYPQSMITGIDFNEKNIMVARRHNNSQNLEFIHGDATTYKFENNYENIVLSNVLEHIDDRVNFLIKLSKSLKPKRILIRVPFFERHWHVAMRKSLNMTYFSDPTHYIEHNLEEFNEEIKLSGLKVQEIILRWGEIWSVCTTSERL